MITTGITNAQGSCSLHQTGVVTRNIKSTFVSFICVQSTAACVTWRRRVCHPLQHARLRAVSCYALVIGFPEGWDPGLIWGLWQTCISKALYSPHMSGIIFQQSPQYYMGETSTQQDQNQASRDCVNTAKITMSNRYRSINPFIIDYFVSLKHSSSFNIDQIIMFSLGVCLLTELDNDNYI